MKKFTVKGGLIELTKEQYNSLGLDAETEKGILKSIGVWQIPVSYRALCINQKFGQFSIVEETTVYGVRTMTNARQSGYCLEGQVSIDGKKRSCFTSDQIIKVDGESKHIATIFARTL